MVTDSVPFFLQISTLYGFTPNTFSVFSSTFESMNIQGWLQYNTNPPVPFATLFDITIPSTSTDLSSFTFYISSSGVSQPYCYSETHPCSSLVYALSTIPAKLSPDNHVILTNDYTESQIKPVFVGDKRLSVTGASQNLQMSNTILIDEALSLNQDAAVGAYVVGSGVLEFMNLSISVGSSLTTDSAVIWIKNSGTLHLDNVWIFSFSSLILTGHLIYIGYGTFTATDVSITNIRVSCHPLISITSAPNEITQRTFSFTRIVGL